MWDFLLGFVIGRATSDGRGPGCLMGCLGLVIRFILLIVILGILGHMC